jgi:hypothetical protein
MASAVGSLVQTRGREWVVLPESTDDLLMLRPLGGADREIAGIYLPLEGADVRPATFDLPDPTRPGDYRSCRLLRDAVRLPSAMDRAILARQQCESAYKRIPAP